MELKYLEQIETISICFNNLKETAFILYKNKLGKNIIQPNNLSLVEQDIHRKIIYKRFKLLQREECTIINKNYKKYPDNSYEGYSLFFWQQSEKLFLLYPFSYILIYDSNTSDLLYHFQYPGMKFFKHPFKVTMGKYHDSLRNIIGSPIENCFFLTGKKISYIYCIDYSILSNENIKINDLFKNKIIIPKDTIIFDLALHPYEKFLYAGFSDGIVRVYDYNNIKKLKELTNVLIDNNNNKNDNNENNTIEQSPVVSLDVNTIGSYLLEGTEEGNIFLWDAFLANKNKKILYKKEKQDEGIFSLKFVKTKQFGDVQKFICLSKKGTIIIYFIIAKDDSVNQPEGRKKPLIEIVYRNNIFNINNFQMPNDILKFNIVLNSLLNISYNNNIISISWPKFLEIEDEKKSNKNECTLIYEGLISKIFFFYSSVYPKINHPSSTQLKNRLYEEFIPTEEQKNFENKIYFADNYYIYLYNISNSRTRKLINYYKEVGTKHLYLLKFDVKDKITNAIFFLLIETSLHRNNLIIADFDFINNTYSKPKIIYNINDFVILGNSYLNSESDFAFLLGRDMVSGFILQISTGNLEAIQLGNNILRTYHSPFNQGYCIIFRTAKNEYKFTQNFSPEIKPANNSGNDSNNNNSFNYSNSLNLKCGDLICFNSEKDEIIIDILFNTISDNCFCATSLISKINIYNREMKFISSIKFNFEESPYLISSIFFLDRTLIYSRNNTISYFYPNDYINQLIMRNNRKPIYISGILPDRFLLVSLTGNSNISICNITTPMINPLEPILIGYLDSPNIDYNLVNQCVINMFTNQISQNLIDKFINKNLKEIAWLFIDDDKSSSQNIDLKLNLMNENLKFENILENIITNKNLCDKLELDDIIWKLNYDSNYQYIKDLLIRELKILIEFGQYNSALKILELLGDYPRAINLLLVSTSPEDFDMLKIKFEAKEALNYTDSLLINNMFNFTKKENENKEIKDNENQDNNILNKLDSIIDSNIVNLPNMNEDKMQYYNKVFDNYEGEHFIFGANLQEFKIDYIEEIQNIIEKDNTKKEKGFDSGIQKKVINFGEKPFNIYSDDYNLSMKQMETLEIYSIILRKIENYYGIMNSLSKNEKEKMKKMMKFYNYNLPLDQINEIEEKQNNINDNNEENANKVAFSKINTISLDDIDENDSNLNAFLDDIAEDLYLCAYYHCDKGNGEILEDITQNENNAIIKCIYNNDKKKAKKEKQDKKDENEEDDMRNIWSEVLNENRPLEYEDKWGRRSPPPHSIVFSKKLKTKILINNSNLFQNIEERFTIEFWINLKDNINANIFTKDAFASDIEKGSFKLTFHGQEIDPEIIKEYTIPIDFYFHLAILYRKSIKNIIILLNCEEIIKFNVDLTIENNTPLIFGNEKLEGEMTEIRIWNQKLPINYIKENYKAPLPILAENKGRLKMNINIKSNKTKRRSHAIFLFGDNKNKDNNIIGDSNDILTNISKKSSKNLFNDNKIKLEDFQNDNNAENNLNEEEYPGFEIVSSYSQSSKDLFLKEKDFIFDN